MSTMFRSCPICRGAGHIEIKCVSCNGSGNVDDWRRAIQTTFTAWRKFTDGHDGAQEELVESLATLREMAKL